MTPWEFPGDPGVSTWCFHCCCPSSIPGQGTKTLQASRQSKINKQIKYDTKKYKELKETKMNSTLSKFKTSVLQRTLSRN